jgi:hypothetical protein
MQGAAMTQRRAAESIARPGKYLVALAAKHERPSHTGTGRFCPLVADLNQAERLRWVHRWTRLHGIRAEVSVKSLRRIKVSDQP